MITTEVMIAESPKDDAPASRYAGHGRHGRHDVMAPAWFNNPATGRVFLCSELLSLSGSLLSMLI